jgi:hypothetical protein
MHAGLPLLIGEALGSPVDRLAAAADVDLCQVCASVAALGGIPLIGAGTALGARLALP